MNRKKIFINEMNFFNVKNSISESASLKSIYLDIAEEVIRKSFEKLYLTIYRKKDYNFNRNIYKRNYFGSLTMDEMNLRFLYSIFKIKLSFFLKNKNYKTLFKITLCLEDEKNLILFDYAINFNEIFTFNCFTNEKKRSENFSFSNCEFYFLKGHNFKD